MRTLQGRLVVGATALAALWVGTYWLWPVRSGEPAILFASEPIETRAHAPVTTPPPQLAAVTPPTARPEPKTTPHAPPATEPAPERPRREETPSSAPGVIPPAFTTRTVQAGQTMQTIAKAVYGDSAKWTVIARANPRVDPVKLKAGTMLRVPVDPNNVQGLPAARPTELAQALGGEPTPTRAEPAGRREHVVAKGETLSGISKQYYGTTTRWRAILEANAEQLRQPEDIRAGMTLVIPEKPAER